MVLHYYSITQMIFCQLFLIKSRNFAVLKGGNEEDNTFISKTGGSTNIRNN